MNNAARVERDWNKLRPISPSVQRFRQCHCANKKKHQRIPVLIKLNCTPTAPRNDRRKIKNGHALASSYRFRASSLVPIPFAIRTRNILNTGKRTAPESALRNKIPKRLKIVGDFPEEAIEFIAAAMPDNVPTTTRKTLFLSGPEDVDSSDKNGNYPTSGKKQLP